MSHQGATEISQQDEENLLKYFGSFIRNTTGKICKKTFKLSLDL